MSCEHVLPSDMGYGQEDATPACECCGDAGWFISRRSNDNRDAVERCDECQMFGSDEEAAVVANRSGVQCEAAYPCYVINQWHVEQSQWGWSVVDGNGSEVVLIPHGPDAQARAERVAQNQRVECVA